MFPMKPTGYYQSYAPRLPKKNDQIFFCCCSSFMFSRSHQIPAAQFLIFFHLAFILAMAQISPVSVRISGRSDLCFPVHPWACCFCVALYTCTTEESTSPLHHSCFILPGSLYGQLLGRRRQRMSAPRWTRQDHLYKRWLLHYTTSVMNRRTARWKEHRPPSGLFNNIS